MLTVDGFDHLVLNVRDVETSARWYERALGMTRRISAPTNGGVPRTSVVFGPNTINLRPVTASQDDWFTGLHPQAGSDDLCFVTRVAPEAVVAHFAGIGVDIVLGPVVKQGARGDIRSVYVRDPDGNLVEVASYP